MLAFDLIQKIFIFRKKYQQHFRKIKFNLNSRYPNKTILVSEFSWLMICFQLNKVHYAFRIRLHINMKISILLLAIFVLVKKEWKTGTQKIDLHIWTMVLKTKYDFGILSFNLSSYLPKSLSEKRKSYKSKMMKRNCINWFLCLFMIFDL